jgi:hypothetical protein
VPKVRAAPLQILPTTPAQYGMPGKLQKTFNKVVNCFLPSVVFDETFSYTVIEICSQY